MLIRASPCKPITQRARHPTGCSRGRRRTYTAGEEPSFRTGGSAARLAPADGARSASRISARTWAKCGAYLAQHGRPPSPTLADIHSSWVDRYWPKAFFVVTINSDYANGR